MQKKRKKKKKEKNLYIARALYTSILNHDCCVKLILVIKDDDKIAI